MKDFASLRPVVATLVVLGLGVASEAPAQTEVAPGELAYFGPDDIDGSFTSQSDDCGGLTNLCRTASDTAAGEAYTYTASIFNLTQSATTVSGLSKSFEVPDDPDGVERVLDARVSGGASWRGSMYVLDITDLSYVSLPSLGAKAEGFVRVSLVDVTDPDNPYDVGNDGIEDFGCDPGREFKAKLPLPLVSDGITIEAEIGVCEEDRAETFSFPAKVVTGRQYELQLAIICQSTTGFPQTLLSVCTFNNNAELDLSMLVTGALDDLDIDDIEIVPQASLDIPFIGTLSFPPFPIVFPVSQIIDDFVSPIVEAILDAAVPTIDTGFLHWDYLNIAVEPDIVGMVQDVETNVIDGIVAAEEAVTAAVEGVGEQVETVRVGVRESIRVLHTSNGQRRTGPLDGYPDLCGDGDCAWAER